MEPVHFSHKKHAALKIGCAYCHTTVETGDRASFPTVGKCMTCHRGVKKDDPEIKRLAALGEAAIPFPAEQVYTVQDFVIFSHARHRKADIDCANCHGKVMQRDALNTQEIPITMKRCVECHQTRKAPTGCHTCHELGQ